MQHIWLVEWFHESEDIDWGVSTRHRYALIRDEKCTDRFSEDTERVIHDELVVLGYIPDEMIGKAEIHICGSFPVDGDHHEVGTFYG